MTYVLWYKALHLISMVAWFAGLFYLPRLFVYHSMSSDQISIDRFRVMERKLYFGITTPAGVLTLLFGFLTLAVNGWSYYSGMWLEIKLVLVAILVIFHLYCGKLLLDFKHERNRHGHVWYRWFNEFPVLLLIAIIILAVIRPV